MQEIREFRLEWIKSKSPTISEIFTSYPRLLDYAGEMIEQDFDYLYPNIADNFLKKFPTYYSPRIHIFVKKCKPALYAEAAYFININDENLRALVMLSALLPVSNSVLTKRGKGKGKGTKRKHHEIDEEPLPAKTIFPNQDLLKIIPDGTSISNYIDEVKKRQKTSIQPYLILVKGQDCDTLFIEGDNWLLSVNEKTTPIAAFNLLYKLFYVFNLKFPDSLQNLYNFIDCFIFQMNVTARSAVSALHVTISNIQISDEKKLDDSNDSLSH